MNQIKLQKLHKAQCLTHRAQRHTFLLLGFALGRLLFAAAAAAVGSLRDGDAVHAAVLKITVHVRLVLLALHTHETQTPEFHVV